MPTLRWASDASRVSFNLPAAANFTGAVTMAALIRHRSIGTWSAIMNHGPQPVSVSPAPNFEFDTSGGFSYDSGSTASNGPILSDITNWYIIAVTKIAGSANPIFYYKRIDDASAWTQSTGGVTIGNAPSQTGWLINYGIWQSSDQADMNMALGAAWNQALTFTQIQALLTNKSTLDWKNHAVPPIYLHELTSKTSIPDLMGNGATLNAVVGTTLDAANDPPGWTFTTTNLPATAAGQYGWGNYGDGTYGSTFGQAAATNTPITGSNEAVTQAEGASIVAISATRTDAWSLSDVVNALSATYVRADTILFTDPTPSTTSTDLIVGSETFSLTDPTPSRTSTDLIAASEAHSITDVSRLLSGEYASMIANTSGLMGYWRLGETFGSSTAADVLGQRDGVYEGTVTQGFDGAINGDPDLAAYFDAAPGTGVRIDNAPAPPSAITMEAWVRIQQSDTGNDRVLDRANPAQVAPHSDYAISVNATGYGGYNFEATIDGSYYVVTSVGSITWGVFTHLAATWDGSEVRLYLNGVLDSVTPLVGSVLASRGAPMYIGRYGWTTGNRLNGTADEVAIYSRALLGSEVATHYTVGMGTLQLAAVEGLTTSDTSSASPSVAVIDALAQTEQPSTFATSIAVIDSETQTEGTSSASNSLSANDAFTQSELTSAVSAAVAVVDSLTEIEGASAVSAALTSIFDTQSFTDSSALTSQDSKSAVDSATGTEGTSSIQSQDSKSASDTFIQDEPSGAGIAFGGNIGTARKPGDGSANFNFATITTTQDVPAGGTVFINATYYADDGTSVITGVSDNGPGLAWSVDLDPDYTGTGSDYKHVALIRARGPLPADTVITVTWTVGADVWVALDAFWLTGIANTTYTDADFLTGTTAATYTIGPVDTVAGGAALTLIYTDFGGPATPTSTDGSTKITEYLPSGYGWRDSTFLKLTDGSPYAATGTWDDTGRQFHSIVLSYAGEPVGVSASISAAVSGGDALAAADVSAIATALATSDSITQSELVTLLSALFSVNDSATQADASALLITLFQTALDNLTMTDASNTSVTATVVDSQTETEQPSALSLSFAVNEAGSLSEQASSIATSLSVFDSLALLENALMIPGTGAPKYEDEVRTDGPKFYWKLDGVGLTQVEDKGGPSIVLNGATPGVPGAFTPLGTSVSFDGINDYGRSVGNVDLTNTQKITIEAWLNWDAYSNNDGLALEHGEGNQGHGFAWDPNSSGGGNWAVFTHNQTGGQFYEEQISRTLMPAGTWHHIVTTIDRTQDNVNGNLIDFHIDGVRVAGIVASSNSQDGTFDNLAFMLMARSGPSDGTKSLYGAGDMQHVAIYDYVLSEGRIQAHYAARNESGFTAGEPITAGETFAFSESVAMAITNLQTAADALTQADDTPSISAALSTTESEALADASLLTRIMAVLDALDLTDVSAVAAQVTATDAGIFNELASSISNALAATPDTQTETESASSVSASLNASEGITGSEVSAIAATLAAVDSSIVTDLVFSSGQQLSVTASDTATFADFSSLVTFTLISAVDSLTQSDASSLAAAVGVSDALNVAELAAINAALTRFDGIDLAEALTLAGAYAASDSAGNLTESSANLSILDRFDTFSEIEDAGLVAGLVAVEAALISEQLDALAGVFAAEQHNFTERDVELLLEKSAFDAWTMEALAFLAEYAGEAPLLTLPTSVIVKLLATAVAVRERATGVEVKDAPATSVSVAQNETSVAIKPQQTSAEVTSNLSQTTVTTNG